MRAYAGWDGSAAGRPGGVSETRPGGRDIPASHHARERVLTRARHHYSNGMAQSDVVLGELPTGCKVESRVPEIQMMKIAVPLATMFAPLCLVLCSCGNGKDAELEAELIDSLRTILRDQDEVSRFDLNATTTFDWDVVHVFLPYTRQTAISDALGTGIDDRLIHQRDDINLLVFTKDGDAAPTLTVGLSRGVCDISPPATDSGIQTFRIASEQAWFEVFLDDAGYCRMTPTHAMSD